MSLLVLVFSSAFALDTVVKDTSGVQEVECPELLCSLCSSDRAYLILEPEFSIEGHLSSTIENLVSMYKELSDHVKGENYTVTIGDSNYCMEANGLDETPDLEELYSDFLSVEYEKINVIELFDVDEECTRVVGVALQGGGVGYAWSELHVEFTAHDTEAISESIVLQLQRLWQVISKSQQRERYEGLADLSGEILNFIINTEYDRDKESGFVVEITNEAHLLGEWVDLLNSALKCSEIVNPRGISYVVQLFPSTAEIAFYWENEEFKFSDIIVSFSVPEFSITTGLYIENPVGNFKLSSENGCLLEIAGEFRIENLPLFGVQVYSNREKYWAEGGIIGDAKQITIQQLEDLTRQFYPDSNPVLPKYPLEAPLVAKLYEVYIVTPLIKIEFYVEPFISIQSSAKIIERADSLIEVYIGRFSTVIDTCIHLYDIKQDSLNELLGLPSEAWEYTMISYPELFSATNRVNLIETPLQVPQEFSYGIYLSYAILDILKLSSDIEYPILALGEYYPTSFYTVALADTVPLFSGVTFHSIKITQYIDPYKPLYISGDLEFQGDSSTILNFTALVDLYDKNYIVEAYLSETWNKALDMEHFAVESLTLYLDIRDSELHRQNAYGTGHFLCEEEDCWAGEVQINFNFSEFKNTVLEMYMNSTSGDVFWEELFRIQPTALSSAFDYSFGCSLEYKINRDEEYRGFAYMSFMNIPALFRTSFGTKTEEIEMTLELTPFTMGYNNIKVTPKQGELIASAKASAGSTSAALSAPVILLGISTDTTITVTDSSLEFLTSGNLFHGVYLFNITVTANSYINLSTANVKIYAELSSEVISSLQEVNELVKEWTENGIRIIELSSSLYDNQTQVVNDIEKCSGECPMISYCSTPLETDCSVYSYGAECIETTIGCIEVSYECTETATYCLSETTECALYSSTIPDECEEYETVCNTDYEVCLKWESICLEEGEGPCAMVSFETSDEICVVDGFKCTEIFIEDPLCVSECASLELRHDIEAAELALLLEVYNATYEDMQGFFQLTDDNLFVVDSGVIDRELDEEGIGPSDIEIKLQLRYFSLENEGIVETERVVSWDFFLGSENKQLLFKLARELIIESSEGSLTGDLLENSPYEVYLENYN